MLKVGINLGHHGRPISTSSSELSRLVRSQGFEDPFYKGQHEYWWIAHYGIGLNLRLMEYKHKTFLCAMGNYGAQASSFNTFHCNLVVLLHVNMMPRVSFGKGKQGKIFLDHRTSALNQKRAAISASYMEERLPWTMRTMLSKPTDWTKAAYNVQQGFRAWTWCFEPFFGDREDQRKHIMGMEIPGLTDGHIGYKGPMAFGALVADSIHEGYSS